MLTASTSPLRVTPCLTIRDRVQGSFNTSHSTLQTIQFVFLNLSLRTNNSRSVADLSTYPSSIGLYTKHCHIHGDHPSPPTASSSMGRQWQSDKTFMMPSWLCETSTSQGCSGRMLFASIKAAWKNASGKSNLWTPYTNVQQQS
jgi:hypothetical protein